jgi:hypothetical protein
MAATKYIYSISNDFLNGAIASDELASEIRESTITIALDYITTAGDVCDIWFKEALSGSEETVLDGIVAAHTGEFIIPSIPVDLEDEWRDRSGKLRVHQTSRKLGLAISWTGTGDDISNITNVYHGEPFTFEFNTASGTGTMSKYIDFNIVENETWLHEGYLTWKNCHFEKLSLQMVPITTGVTVSSGTNYNLYGGYLVVPAYPGTGTIAITSDITGPRGGLIYMPDDDLGESPIAYWNADWNSTTKKYENISAAPNGNGRYNMFAVEVVFAEFVSQIALLSSGFIGLDSSDTDQMGQGMRLKMILEPGNHNGTEEIVGVACILCLHRESSV